jgi:hypothetical protein
MAKDVLITPTDGLIQFSSSAGTGSGTIQADGDNLVISNAIGDVLLGDGASDVFIGDGTNNVDIVFEQNGEIRDDGTGKSVTLGSSSSLIFITGSSSVTLQKDGGNVGIGSTVTDSLLHISGAVISDKLFHIEGSDGVDVVFVTGSGNVGVGTTNPNNPLSVSGSLTVFNLNETSRLTVGEADVSGESTSNSMIIETTGASNKSRIFTVGTSNDMVIETMGNTSDIHLSSDRDIRFGVNNNSAYNFTEKMIMKNDGKFGIGTSDPTETLEIVAGGRIKVTPGTDTTGSIFSLAADHDVLFSSQNDSATGDPQQFVIQHNDGATELVNRRGDLILSSSGDITLDADGTDIVLKDGGTSFGSFKRASSDFIIKAETADKDILFKGTDDSSTITALTLDMSEAGNAIFNNDITAVGNVSSSLTSTGSFGKIEGTKFSGDGGGLTNVTATADAGTISSSLHIFSAITSSGDISASGNITVASMSIGGANFKRHLTVAGDISASGDMNSSQLNVNMIANNTYGLLINNVDGEEQYKLNVDSNQHSDFSMYKDGTEKLRFGTYWPTVIDNDFYATNGGLILGDADHGSITNARTNNRYGLYVSAGPDSGSAYFAERVDFNSDITSSGNISSSGTIIAEHLETTDDLTVADDINLGDLSLISFGGAGRGKISGSALNLIVGGSDLVIQTGSSNTALRVDTSAKGNVGIEGLADLVIKNNITSSVDSKFQWGALDGNRVQIQNGQITASGEISSSSNIIGATGSFGTGSFGAISIGDNERIKLGDAGDLQIYHNGSNSVISDVGTGDLLINGNDIRIRDANDGNTIALFTQGAGVELRHDNTVRFETTTTGINVTGDISSSGTHRTSLSEHRFEGNISSSGNYIGDRQFSKTTSTDADYQGDVVYFGGTTSMDNGKIYHYKSDGTWELADADAVATSDGLLAVALGAASDTNGMLLRGTVTLDHDPGAVGDVLFLSTTAGQATATAPSGNTDIVRVVGYCLDASNGQIWFNPSSTFVEVSA